MPALWAITTYFNPMGYARRLANFHTFRRHVNVPLIAVEWSWSEGSPFELRPGDADVLIQLRSPDLLWQKERLLNLALAALPASCELVAWLDCDVVFENAGWPTAAARMLETFPLIHLCQTACDLHACDIIDENGQLAGTTAPALTSLVAGKSAGIVHDDLFQQSVRLNGYAAGFAWAARRDLLDRHGLYDACVSGSGSRVILCAAYGLFTQAAHYVRMTPQWQRHFLAWAEPLYHDMQGHVGCLPGQVLHLWHGDLKRRQYMDRHRILNEADFDPATDLAIDAAGCWRWNSDKPLMHTQLRDYFASRREDG